ncbi:response regulator [Eubacterium ruminantium]|uniref:response regulator n=1 Tax=Eubacterium ruminantium TaxID=42322 RepID=UPI001568C1DB|nr:helix-turn-helix domain-containing protein [Eubacterium ruminantium]
MYKILIADDESIVIDALKYIIENNFPDKCMIECANTGRKVIEQAEYFRPDIVFMDIQMPGINGIEAMREIRKTNDSIIFIVVSAFVKFDYAKDAIDIGVLDYINKPIDKDEIISILDKAMKKVDLTKTKRSEELSNKEKLEIVTPIIENGFIYSLIYQNHSEDELSNFRTLLSIDEDAGYMMALQFGDMDSKGHMENAIGTTVRLQKEYSRIKDAVKTFFKCCVGAMMGNMILVFVPKNVPESAQEYEIRIEIINNARKMTRELRRMFDAWFRVGIGTIHRLESLVESYNEAVRSLAFNSSDSVVHVNDMSILRNYETDYPVDTENALFKSIEEGNVNRATFYSKAFFDWMMEKHDQNVMDIKLKVLELVLRAEKIGFDSGSMIYRFNMRSEYLDDIMKIQIMTQLYDWFLAKITGVCNNILTKREENTVDIIKNAQTYIEKNYSKDLILDDVSKELKISPYYFSKLFKKRTGSTFIEYVTAVRIEKSKELLRNTSKSMKEICIEVGYADANYFSRTFKKNVGVTPSEYKEGKE